MKRTRIAAKLVAVTAVAGFAALGGAPWASADASVVSLGGRGELVNGDVVQQWTISDLRPSSDAIPYAAQGTLWEAKATDVAVRGTVIPIVSNLNARSSSGDNYRVLFGVATPQGVNPATLAQGQQTSGKVYFDVTGSAPSSVVYNAGGEDLAVWVAPAPRQGGVSSGYSGGQGSSTAPAGSAAAAGASAAAAGNQGTPLAPGATGPAAAPAAANQGTPLPAEGTSSTPSGAAATPAPATAAAPTAAAPTSAVPSPVGNQGTPIPATGASQSAAPTTAVAAPASTG